MVVSDEAATRTALSEAGVTHREIEILPVAMQHLPGEAYRACQKLADAGINIELFLPTGSHDGKFIVALGCSNVEAARRALGTQVVKEYGDLWPKAMAGVR